MPDHGAEVLDRYWDTLIAGEPAASPSLDPALAESVRRLHAAQDVDRADPAFVDHLWEKLINVTAQSYPPVQSAPIGPGIAAEQRETSQVVDLSRLVRRRLSVFAAAAILLAALGGIAAFWLLDGGDSGSHTGAPAIHAPASPSPEATPDDELFEITLPADVVPHTQARFAAIQYVSIPPGVDSHWTPYWGTGPYGEYVMSGSYRERIEADVQILRATGILEEVPANTEFTLGPGDLLISLNENKVETINDGAVSAEVLTWLFMDDPGGRFAGRNEEGWIGNNFATKGEADLPSLPGAVTLRLQRMSLGPDDQVFAPPESVQIALQLDRLTETVLMSTDSSYFKASNLNGAPETVVYVLTLLPADSGGSAMPTTPLA